MLAGGPEPCDAGYESALGRRQVAAEPFGDGQKSLGDGTWQRFFLTGLGQHTAGQHGCGLGVTAELGEIGLAQCLQRGKVHEQAGGPADGGLERLLGRARGRALGRVEQRLHRIQPAAGGG